MKAIVLCAGQGRRLLPFTERTPKCLLPVGGKPILGWQLQGLAKAGIREATLVTGFRAETIEAALPDITPAGLTVRTVFNPFFGVAENIGSCFLVRDLLRAADTVLLNGDTLFEPAVLRHLLASPAAPITVTIDRKPEYDADDMKVETRGGDLVAIGKTIRTYDAESIGFLRFSDRGAARFRSAMEAALRDPENLRRWYLSIIHELAREGGGVSVCSIEGLGWGEMYFLADVATNEALVQGWLAR